ncbi:MAG TPA: hypothetical protein VD969_05130 [Symbiobacteriaceae bacterium]|nr:hypothetical protein [Symbiobacteriaceae bacterium]
MLNHFVNEQSPVAQEALNDARALASEDKWINGPTVSDVQFKSIVVDGDRASVHFREQLLIRNPGYDSGAVYNHAWELVRREGQWFVAGLSTFPGSSQRNGAAKAVVNWLRSLGTGRAPAPQGDRDGGLEILQQWAARRQAPSVGQIQFWRMSEPHLAPSPEEANYARVTLRDDKDTYYLVLNMWKGRWRPTSLGPASVRPAWPF